MEEEDENNRPSERIFFDLEKPNSPYERFFFGLLRMIDGPVTWWREKIVEPNRPKYYYYHQKFRRVPTVDECYVKDHVCIYEANQQFYRDKQVDSEILNILRKRRADCGIYENPDQKEKCKLILEQYEEAATSWFIKYGDLGARGDVKDAYMKQKHRLIWERRHGSNRGDGKDL